MSKRAFPHNLNISASANGGIIAHVGCKNFCYGSSNAEKERAIDDFRTYVLNPEVMIKDYSACDEDTEDGEGRPMTAVVRQPASMRREPISKQER
jgi:hypothetical protein